MDINRNNAFFEKLKENVTDTFDRLRKAIDMREKLLLRQLTVLVQQAQHITFEYDSIRFLGDGEDELVGRIRTYGRYNIDNFNVILQKEPYENEDYILPSNDHDLMHKSCRQGADDERNPESEEIVVEFFNNRSLIKDSAEMVRESIINLTLNESRELIDRTIGGSRPYQGAVDVTNEEQPTVDGTESSLRACKIDPTTHRLNRGRNSLTDIPFDSLSFQGDQQQEQDGSNNNVVSVANGNSKHIRTVSRDGETVISLSLPPQRMIPKASQTDGLIVASATDSEGNIREPTTCKAAIDKRMKNVNHVTMNSCGSTINLKNVTNLTINSCSERPQLKEKERTIPETDPKCPSEEGSPECGFYKRLITENKILRNHILKSKLGGGVGSRFIKSQQPMVSSSASVGRSLSSVTNDETITNSKQPSQDTDGLSSSGSSTSSSIVPPVVQETNLNIPLSEQELQQMFDGVPTSMYEKSLSFVLGELYGMQGGLDGNGAATLTSSGPGKTKDHTMQIQQWLKQIISEAETEPFQNAEMLEFSKIHD
ncbi:uncharacterized protein LOC128714712 [Anopheles marshallii]|uniref:uncharacterized protein LOC128714712 n=1 Tax=Anopheles marshallii TaxID=1521116 RepID=UPI00237B818D|nr:uncharacterized protein LOC128714712 [Anopheles marshallii]